MLEFTQLQSLQRTLEEFRSVHTASLGTYFDLNINGFRHMYRSEKNKLSRASTATCIGSLVDTNNWHGYEWDKITIPLAKELLTTKWESAGLDQNNVFTVSFVLEAVHTLSDVMTTTERDTFLQNQVNAEKMKEGIGHIARQITEGFAQINPYPSSAYLTQLSVRSLKRLNALDDELASKVRTWAENEMDHQIALMHARSKSADIYQLAYTIILVATLDDVASFRSDRNMILNYALDQVFEHQLPDGTWPRSRPLFHYPDIGNAYCYEYEMLTQLLKHPVLFDRLLLHLPRLCLSVEHIQKTAYRLPESGMGWPSGHHPQLEGPESWTTASVYHFVHMLDRLVAEAIRRRVFAYFDTPYVKNEATTEFAEKFLDCPLWVDGERRQLKNTMLEAFVRPIKNQSAIVAMGGRFSNETPVSAILFGPPGTSKTELSRVIADYLGWPRLTIDSSHFMREGMDNILAVADTIFSMLAASEGIVVLLDEFDEMVRQRSGQNEVLSRFLTTAMLPKLALIGKSRRIVFLVATNYVDDFDLAIRRLGRFDMILQVLPPLLDEKLKKYSEFAAKLVSGGIQLDRDTSVRNVLDDLTYDEFGLLVRKIQSAESGSSFHNMIVYAGASCTMSAPYDSSLNDTDSALSLAWRVYCERQRSRVRLPVGYQLGVSSIEVVSENTSEKEPGDAES